MSSFYNFQSWTAEQKNKQNIKRLQSYHTWHLSVVKQLILQKVAFCLLVLNTTKHEPGLAHMCGKSRSERRTGAHEHQTMIQCTT